MSIKIIPKDVTTTPPKFYILKDGKEIGLIDANIVKSNTSIYYISGIAIYDRNKGLGSEVIKFIIENCRKIPFLEKIGIESTKKSLNFWKRNGFVKDKSILAEEPGCIRMKFKLK